MVNTDLCPFSITCPGTDYPISNYSSELEDSLIYVGLAFPGQSSPPGTDPGGSNHAPPLGQDWYYVTCFGIGEASSPEEANRIALANSETCNSNVPTGGAYAEPVVNPLTGPNPGGPTGATKGGIANGPSQIPQSANKPGGGPGSGKFWNTAQEGSAITCPEGYTASTFTQPAGTISAKTQALADNLAKQEASRKAQESYICVPDLSGSYCLNETLDGAGLIFGAKPPFQIELTNAPPGMLVFMVSDTEFLVEGKLTTAGSYECKTKVTDSEGNTAEADAFIFVFGVTNVTGDPPELPDAHSCAPYSFKFETEGGLEPITFTQDPLYPPPSGLTLESDGTLHGTPGNTQETVLMKFTITDSGVDGQGDPDPISCGVEVYISVTEYDGPCFSSGQPPPISTDVPYSFTFVPAQPLTPPAVAFQFLVTAGSLPPGLNLDAGTGVLSGTVLEADAGTYTFTVSVTGGCEPCSQEYTVEARCHADVSSSPPGTVTLYLVGAGSDSREYYLVQRSGGNMTLSMDVTVEYAVGGDPGGILSLGTTFGADAYDMDTGLPIFTDGNSWGSPNPICGNGNYTSNKSGILPSCHLCRLRVNIQSSSPCNSFCIVTFTLS